jgi:hypothetical protein
MGEPTTFIQVGGIYVQEYLYLCNQFKNNVEVSSTQKNIWN